MDSGCMWGKANWCKCLHGNWCPSCEMHLALWTLANWCFKDFSTILYFYSEGQSMILCLAVVENMFLPYILQKVKILKSSVNDVLAVRKTSWCLENLYMWRTYQLFYMQTAALIRPSCQQISPLNGQNITKYLTRLNWPVSGLSLMSFGRRISTTTIFMPQKTVSTSKRCKLWDSHLNMNLLWVSPNPKLYRTVGLCWSLPSPTTASKSTFLFWIKTLGSGIHKPL